MALNIGQIGENLALGSATVVKAAENESICGLCHPRYFFKIFMAVLTSFEFVKKRKILKNNICSSGAVGDVQYGRYAALLSFKGNSQGPIISEIASCKKSSKTLPGKISPPVLDDNLPNTQILLRSAAVFVNI